MEKNFYKETVRVLLEAKKLSQVFNTLLKKNHEFLEENFLKNYRGKTIVLITANNEEIQGRLENMTRYRIEISDENGKYYYYHKNMLLGFYALP